jgi:hypothetical protein
MNLFLKLNCIALYVLALLALIIELPFGSGPVLQNIALIMLVIHVIEIPIGFRKIKLYEGSLGASIGLTLLFGFLHWRSLQSPMTTNSLI